MEISLSAGFLKWFYVNIYGTEAPPPPTHTQHTLPAHVPATFVRSQTLSERQHLGLFFFIILRHILPTGVFAGVQSVVVEQQFARIFDPPYLTGGRSEI